MSLNSKTTCCIFNIQKIYFMINRIFSPYWAFACLLDFSISALQVFVVALTATDIQQVRGQLFSAGLEKEPNCLVFTSLSCSSCLCPRLYRYSMCITSVFLMQAFTLNSSRIRGMKPGLSWPARRNCRYRARTCFCSLLCRAIGLIHQTKDQKPGQQRARRTRWLRDWSVFSCSSSNDVPLMSSNDAAVVKLWLYWSEWESSALSTSLSFFSCLRADLWLQTDTERDVELWMGHQFKAGATD